MIPNGPILEGYEQYCSCYEFQVNVFGEMNDDSFDAADFNYHFDGHITPDSIYYSAAEGSPFSSNSRTIYGKKIE